MIIRKVDGLWVVQREKCQQILFSHKKQMECYEWIFTKYVHYAQQKNEDDTISNKTGKRKTK